MFTLNSIFTLSGARESPFKNDAHAERLESRLFENLFEGVFLSD